MATTLIMANQYSNSANDFVENRFVTVRAMRIARPMIYEGAPGVIPLSSAIEAETSKAMTTTQKYQ